ncbi:hypothetical protein MtrunA17_Chr5g0396051 [Medicago truncatula]|uniref:Transmembrane protein n=1 Tax=Medicago truncatula TaxID=3880 RepID=A0A396HQ26_MEDTR|nr:hypothetical protein MtrunA17_Chr5g0396051 [Medicago truncatula]
MVLIDEKIFVLCIFDYALFSGVLVCICSSAPVMPILYIYCAAGKKKYQFATTSAGGVASLNAQLF